MADRRVAATMLALSVTGVALAGQTATFKAGVDLVRVDVSVTRGGQPVRGLGPADFSVTDSGVGQRINSVTLLDDLPVSVLMVLDTSSSVSGERLQHLVDGSRALLANLRRDDRAGLMTFSDRAELKAPLGTSRDEIRDLLGTLVGRNTTALNDAVWTALQLSPSSDDTRPLVLVFSDGLDTSSWLTQSQLFEAARRQGIVIHAVELGTPVIYTPRGQRAAVATSPLGFAAEASGGRSWSATSPRDLRALFTKAIDEMRARYLVTFYPEGVPRPGWHPLKIGARGRGEVLARAGYYKAAAPAP